MRTRRHFFWVACSCTLAVWVGARTWGFEQANDAPVGLQGVIAAFPPSGLTQEDFSEIAETVGPAWRDWVLETGELVRDFYEGDHPTIESQRAALRRLQVKLRTIEKALQDRRYRSIHATLADLHGPLRRQVDLSEAILDTLTVDRRAARQRQLGPAFERMRTVVRQMRREMQDYRGGQQWMEWTRANELAALSPADEQWPAVVDAVKTRLERRDTYADEIRDFLSQEVFLRLEDALGNLQRIARLGEETDAPGLREQLAQLLDVIDRYEQDPNAALEAEIRGQFDAIRATAPDGGAAISHALQTHFLNYNLRLLVSEGLLNRFVMESRQEGSWVNRRVMEAHVTGYQCTNTQVRLDLRPSSGTARFALVLNGNVQANTQGRTHQATVQMIGSHAFHAEKPVDFNGENFLTGPAMVSVSPNTQAVGARTRVSRLPLIGRIADNVAMREARSRQPQANALASTEIRQEVQPRFDRETDQQFSQAAMQLQSDVYGPLRKYGLYPDVMALSSTHTDMSVWTRLMDRGELGGSRPAPGIAVPSSGMVAQLHESLLTNGIERFELAGRTMTEREIRHLLEDRFSEILGREVTLDAPEVPEGESPADTMIVFAEQDPVRFVVRGGEIILVIRAGLRREGAEDIPEQIITVPFGVRVAQDQIVLDRGGVGVRPVDRPPSVAAQVARANVMRQRIQSALPERSFDATFDVEQQRRVVTLNITDISARNGWLTVSMQ